MDGEDESNNDFVSGSEEFSLPVLVHTIAVKCVRHEAVHDELVSALERRFRVRAAAPKLWPKLSKVLWVNCMRDAAPKDVRKLQRVVLKHNSNCDFLREVFSLEQIFEHKLTDESRRLSALALGRDIVQCSLRHLDEAWLFKVFAMQNRVLRRHLQNEKPEQGYFRDDSKAIRIVTATLRLRFDVASATVQWLEQQGPTADALALLAVAMTYFSKGKTDDMRQVWQDRLKPIAFAAYIELVQKAQAQDAWELEVFEPLIAELRGDAWGEVLAAILSSSKKHPSPTAAVISHLADNIPPYLLDSVDASALASDQALAPVLRNLKSSSEDSRRAACRTVKAVLSLNGLAVREHVGQRLCRILSGKDGPLPQWYQRCGVVLGLQAVLASASCPTKAEASRINWEDAMRTSLGGSVASILLEVLAKEAHEETASNIKEGLASALALARNFDVISPVLEELLSNADLAYIPLAGLCAALPRLRERCGVSALRLLSPSVYAELTNWINDAQQKNSAQKNGVFALYVMSAVNVSDTYLDCINDPDWFVYASGVRGPKGTVSLWTYGSCNREVLVAACRCLGILLCSEKASDALLTSTSSPSEELTSLGLPNPSPGLLLLCLCATSVDSSVRETAHAVLQDLHSKYSCAALTPAILAAIFESVQQASVYFAGDDFAKEESQSESLLESEDSLSAGGLPQLTSKYYQRTLEAAFSNHAELDGVNDVAAAAEKSVFEQFIPAVLLLASHPVLTGVPFYEPRLALRRNQQNSDYFKHLVQYHMLFEPGRDGRNDAETEGPVLPPGLSKRTADALLQFSLSHDAVLRVAARASIATLAGALSSQESHSDLSRTMYLIGGKVILERLVPRMINLLWDSEVFTLTEKELLAYTNPEEAGEEPAEAKTGAKPQKNSETGLKVPPKARSKANARAKPGGKKTRKGKGLGSKRKKGTGIETLGSKPAAKPKPAAKKPKSFEPKLTYGQKVQRRVRKVKLEVERLLANLDTVLYASPEEGHNLIPVLLPLLLEFFGVSVSQDAALESLCALASTCDVCSLLPHLILPMAGSLRLVATTKGKLPEGFLVQRTVQQIAGLCLGDDPSGDLDFNFSPQTYALIQPLLLAVIGQEVSSSVAGSEEVRNQLLARHVIPLLHAHSAIHEALNAEEDTLSGAAMHRRDVLLGMREQNVLLALRCIRRLCELRSLETASGRADPTSALLKVCDAKSPMSLLELNTLMGSEGLFSEHVPVRRASARVRPELSTNLTGVEGSDPSIFDLRGRLWVSCHDSDAQTRVESRAAWTGLDLSAVTPGFGIGLGFEVPCMDILQQVPNANVRDAVAAALAAGVKSLVEDDAEAAGGILKVVIGLFEDNPPPQTRDSSKEVTMEELFGTLSLSREEASRDKGKPFREAAAAILGAFGKYRAFSAHAQSNGSKFADAKAGDAHVDQSRPLLEQVINFVINEGLQENDADVRYQMLRAGAKIAKGYGPSHCLAILDIVEERLESLLQTTGSATEEEIADFQREGCVILLGTAATFLDSSSEPGAQKLTAIIDLLGATLATPSAAVQSSTGDVLGPLVQKVPATAHQLLDTLIGTCLFVDEADRKSKKDRTANSASGARMSYGQRRGAAVGLAAIVKGLGIGCMAQHNIVEQLETAANSGMGAKEGTLLAMASLSGYLEILFEPYVNDLLPILLRLFSDASDRVREAASTAARNVMMHLSSYGVKLLLPSALKALGEPAWRVKQAAIGVLGAMSSCSPKQLSRFLPDIIPPLASTVSDAHQRVRDAGARALKDMGDVMKNPEIREISDIIFKALGNPTKHTGSALVSLLAVEFKHAVDVASLAFCVPLLVRGLKTRGHEQKRHAASITGNLVQVLAKADSMLPYLDLLVEGLKPVLHDAMPDVRAVAARSMGAMIRGLGEEPLSALIDWLLETSRNGESNAVRSGSAQGLSEALLVLGSSRCNAVLDQMIADSRNPSESVREGVLWLLCFLPPGLGSEFSHRIGEALPVVLHGLTDESDSVRDVARKAGQVLVGSHGSKFSSLFVAPLQNGLLDDNWRMREASVQLLGDLLYKIGGTRAVGVADAVAEDGDRTPGVNAGADAANAAILDVLGRAQRNSVLALLYMVRNDIETSVRQLAVTVWKTVVPNLGRALREITGELIQHIIGSLSSTSFDRRLIAGRSLGELVRKLGDTVLPDILPFLRAGLDSPDEGKRQGVCMGLAQVFEHASGEQIEEYMPILVPAICKALCDNSSKVREAAAGSFQTLYRSVGPSALDAVIPDLVSALSHDVGEGDSPAIFGLQSVIRLQPTELLQHLVPSWTRPPISITKLRAVAAASRAAGSHVHFHFRMLIPFIRSGLAHDDSEIVEAAELAGRSLSASTEEVGLQWLSTEMCNALDDEDATVRASGAVLVRLFFESSPMDYSEQLPIFLRHMVPLLVDSDSAALANGHAAFTAMSKAAPEETLAEQVQFFRSTLASEVSNAKLRKGGVGVDNEYLLPATNEIPRGLAPFLPMFVTALKSGTSAAREAAATGLVELVGMTEEKALKPFVAKLLGPLIRIGGNRLPPEVKGAIIRAQCGILDRGGPGVKTFVPQLQTTFTKAALDETSTSVRRAGVEALVKLMMISPRVPQVLQELGTAAGDPEILPPVRVSALSAIRGILRVAGAKVGPAHLNNLSDPLIRSLQSREDLLMHAAAKALGSLVVHLGSETIEQMLTSTLLSREPGREGLALGFAEVLKQAFDKTMDAMESSGISPPLDEILRLTESDLQASNQTLRICGCRCWAAMVLAGVKLGRADILDALFGNMAVSEGVRTILKDKSDPDLRVVGLKVMKEAAKVLVGPHRRQLAFFVGAVYDAARGTQTKTRSPAERAMVHLSGSGCSVALDLGSIALREGWIDPDRGAELAEHTRKIYSRMPAESDDEDD